MRWRLAVIVIVVSALAMVGCSPKRVLRTEIGPEPEAVAPRPESPTPPDRDDTGPAARVAALVQAQIGVRYQWGGSGPDRGFDCSGLVQWAYGEVGVPLPRVVRDQRHEGDSVGRGSLQPGDLLFFAMNGGRVDHVGIHVGEGEFVHAPSSGRPVRTDSLRDEFWRLRWRDARRLLAD